MTYILRTFSLVAIFLLCFNAGFAQLPAYVPSSGLILYYGFNGNANDLSGNGINGTVTGPTYTSDRFGYANAALLYTGSGERVTTTKIDRVNTNSFTYSVWVNPSTSATIPTQGGNGGLSSAEPSTCVIAPVNGWCWSPSSTDVAAGLNVSTSGIYVTEHGPGITYVSLSYSASLSGWHHVVIVYNAKQPSLYLDGTFIQNGITSTHVVHPSLGCDSFASGGGYPYLPAGFGHGLFPVTVPTYNFTGNIDDIAIYSRAITPCEITQLYDTTITTLPIVGTTMVCAGSTTSLSSTISGGTWTSGSTSIATAGSSTGVVTGVTGGTASITYALGTGCSSSTVVTVSPFPVITGTGNMCNGTGTSLSDALSGGTWTSTLTTVATVSSTGGITSVSPGTSTISYTLSSGCARTVVVTVNPLPSPITGVFVVCPGSTTSLTDAGSGTWTSSNTSVATAGLSTGIISGIVPGTATITYMLPTGCATTAVVTVNSLPPAITGTPSVCPGTTTTLSDAASGGGTWTSGTTPTATVGLSSGLVTGFSPGTSLITFSQTSTGCITTMIVTVNPLPNPISGTMTVCAGAITVLSDAGGGTWTSANTTVATVSISSGAVLGVSAGTTTITYTLPTGCITTTTVTVYALPSTISGAASLCAGQSTTFSDATPGGTWASSYPAVAGIGPSSGLVTSISGGTTTITYTVGTGCITTMVLTVNPTPGFITGITKVCAGYTTTLSDAGGGTWTSSNTAIADVALTTGVVTGMSTGTATITYSLSTGCTITTGVTVNTSPSAITGATGVCIGTTSALSNTTGGGLWTSSSTAVATVSSSGLVTGVSAGMSIITYKIFATGCFSTATVTVSSAPGAIGGNTNICIGSTTALSNAVTGGTWTSSNTSIATVVLSSGVATGVATGTATITYSLGGSCKSTTTVTVNPAATPISGTSTVCAGSSATLSNSTTGGTWSSSNTAVATIAGSGITTGVAAGTTTITYTLGCSVTTTFTVKPSPATIAGGPAVCQASVVNLSDAVSGGTWSSSNTSVGTITGTGDVSGLSPGTTTISYSLGSCSVSKIITVNPSLPITGGTILCVGHTTVLSDGVTGGTWSSGSTGVATVAGGIVTGVAAGTSTIVYSLPTGCINSTTVTVSPSPTVIIGSSSLCVGTTINLTDAVPGGNWTSGSTSVATIGITSGDVNGLTAGTTIITYSLGSGCSVNKTVTVNPLPLTISGTTTVCAGTSSPLSDATPGGAWSSSNTAVATISGTGLTAGLSAGTATITYSLGCIITTTFSVKPTPTAIMGASDVCQGSNISFSDAVTGGTWTSSNTAVATITGTGAISGITPGTSSIVYSLGAGCTATKTISVDPTAPITGASSLCVGFTTTLSDALPGGTWSSSASSVATVSSGVVSGLLPGTSVIGYTMPSGCIVTTTVTVNSVPMPISGNPQVCVGLPTSLSDIGTGAWTSSSTTVATVGLSSGIVMGATTGTATITYSFGSGCTVTMAITVNPVPAAITGGSNVCAGFTTVFSDATTGGTWSSDNTTVANIGGTGTISALLAGTSTISYTLASGCSAAKLVNVNAIPAPISGIMQVCAGLTTVLSDAGTGTWSSSIPSKATIGIGTGLVNGITAGTTNITYTLLGCTASTTVTVFPLPSAISGTPNMCIGSGTALSDATPGGAWSSDNTSIATVSSGLVSGVGVGTTTITYTLPTGCISTRSIIVKALPAVIAGTTTICTGNSATLSDPSTGGTWTSGSPGIATIGFSSGIVNGMSGGTSTITYSMGIGCNVMTTVTVNTTPVAIAGTMNVCVGLTSALSDATTGGAWSSSNTAIATIDAAGTVTGMTAGTAIINYVLNGCGTNAAMTVNPLPATVTGGTEICAGSATVVSDATVGGTWSSSSTTTAIIGKTSGIITGLASGTSTIIYTLPTGCIATSPLTVDPLPAAVSGPNIVCGSLAITLSDATPGGSWSSSNTTVATVGAVTGIVNGGAGGSATIAYTLPTGCLAMQSVTVNPAASPIRGAHDMCNAGSTITVSDADAPAGTWTSTNVTITTAGLVTAYTTGPGIITYTLPTGCLTTATLNVLPDPGAITGASTACTSGNIVLADTTAGGAWTSSAPTVAVIDGGTGILTGVTAGTTIVSYTLPDGCGVADTIVVYPTPSAIAGTPQVCFGAMTTFSDALTGGTWSSSAPSVATVMITSGDVTGMSSGSATITYTSGAGCIITQSVTVQPLPVVFGVSGGGILCAGDPGVHVLLSGSALGIRYDLYNGPSIAGAKGGIGSFLDFGPQTASGSYTVTATDTTSGCGSNMSGSALVIVNPKVTPDVNLTVAPTTTVCEGTPVSFVATPTNGGSAPIYGWKVNGTIVGTGTTSYSYTPKDGDVVIAMMTSNATCVTVPEAYAFITMTVVAPMIPTVSILADPGTSLAKGQSVTFTTIVTNGGLAPTYQWTLNGTNIAGANGPTYTTTKLAHNDVINCLVVSDGMCSASAKGQDVRILVSSTAIAIVSSKQGIMVVPNPNKGAFTISGSFGTSTDETISLELTDMIGQVVYSGKTKAVNGMIDQQVQLSNSIASGMYLLSIRSEAGNKVFHVVIEQ